MRVHPTDAEPKRNKKSSWAFPDTSAYSLLFFKITRLAVLRSPEKADGGSGKGREAVAQKPLLVEVHFGVHIRARIGVNGPNGAVVTR